MLTHFLTFMRNPLGFLSTGLGGVGINRLGSVMADAAAQVNQPAPVWVGALAEWLGLGVVAFSLLCGALTAGTALGSRINRMRNGESFWSAFFTKEKEVK